LNTITKRRSILRFPAIAVLVWLGQCAQAQELTPRAYWPAPVGTNVLVVGYVHNTGDILIDPSLPITGVESDIDSFALTYQRALDVLGRSASVQFNLPYSNGLTEGFVEGEYRQRKTVGLADMRARFAINLAGAAALDPAGFTALRKDPRPIVGASVVVQAPTGEYDVDRLINVGTNRWSIKPAIGAIIPLRPTWLLELELGAWFYGDNDDYQGETREQDPIVSLSVHLIKRLRPGFWVALDANYYKGGETRVGDAPPLNLQRNSRAGFTVVMPFRGRHAVRASFSTGVETRSGGDFDNYSLAYIVAW
jgi:hypothetical protein